MHVFAMLLSPMSKVSLTVKTFIEIMKCRILNCQIWPNFALIFRKTFSFWGTSSQTPTGAPPLASHTASAATGQTPFLSTCAQWPCPVRNRGRRKPGGRTVGSSTSEELITVHCSRLPIVTPPTWHWSSCVCWDRMPWWKSKKSDRWSLNSTLWATWILDMEEEYE